jgi:hypothetical protein
MSAKAASISTCHSHQLACQLRAKATATIASASRTKAVTTATTIAERRRR